MSRPSFTPPPHGGLSETKEPEPTTGHCKECGREADLVDGLCGECRWKIKVGMGLPPAEHPHSLTSFFRHCPECGRRFNVRLVSKQMDATLEPEIKIAPPRVRLEGDSRVYPVVEAGGPVRIDRDEFRYTYRCGHCGHEWSEEKVEKHAEIPRTIKDQQQVQRPRTLAPEEPTDG